MQEAAVKRSLFARIDLLMPILIDWIRPKRYLTGWCSECTKDKRPTPDQNPQVHLELPSVMSGLHKPQRPRYASLGQCCNKPFPPPSHNESDPRSSFPNATLFGISMPVKSKKRHRLPGIWYQNAGTGSLPADRAAIDLDRWRRRCRRSSKDNKARKRMEERRRSGNSRC